MTELPSICSEHPNAQIKHEWDRTITRFRLTGASIKEDDNHVYLCSVCGKQLCSPEEYEKRMNSND